LEVIGEAMSMLTPEPIEGIPPNGKPVRVLLFRDRQTAELAQIAGTDGAIQIVGEASNCHEALVKIVSLQPDVILMITDSDTSFIDFSATTRALYELQLTGKVIIVSDNPVKYLGLAVKVRAAALLSRKINTIAMVSALHKVNILSQDLIYPVEILSRQDRQHPENWPGGDRDVI
jgi:DNA-binding NarL/FixJ family response regulator